MGQKSWESHGSKIMRDMGQKSWESRSKIMRVMGQKSFRTRNISNIISNKKWFKKQSQDILYSIFMKFVAFSKSGDII
jgi:hypothetical protein